MEQHEITTAGPLLDSRGNLVEAGYAKKPLTTYGRHMVHSFPMRRKEWDSYLVVNGQFGLALSIGDHSSVGLDTISFLDFWDQWQVSRGAIRLLSLGATSLPVSSGEGDAAAHGRGYSILFRREEGKRTLNVHADGFLDGKPLDAQVELIGEPEESAVLHTPFDRPGQFCLNQKISGLRASGTVLVGEEEYVFDPADSFGILDWSRGAWSGRHTRHWAAASGLVDGALFGFSLGEGLGNSSAATENMLFYEGKAHKLSKVRFRIPGRRRLRRYMDPWEFTSDNSRFEMIFRPILDRAVCTGAGVAKWDRHQVFGRFSGLAVLDDGTEICVKDFLGFAEEAEIR